MKTALLTREFYIPKGAAKVTPKTGGVVFYLYDNRNGKPTCMCFIGRAEKPSWTYYYSSADARAKAMARQVEAITEHAAMLECRKAERNKPHNWEPGLILTSSWGYEQTNVSFYEVLRLVGSTMVEIQEIGAERATDSSDEFSSMADYCVPDPKTRKGTVTRHKVKNGNAISLASFETAYVWDGKACYRSWYA